MSHAAPFATPIPSMRGGHVINIDPAGSDERRPGHADQMFLHEPTR